MIRSVNTPGIVPGQCLDSRGRLPVEFRALLDHHGGRLPRSLLENPTAPRSSFCRRCGLCAGLDTIDAVLAQAVGPGSRPAVEDAQPPVGQ